MKMRKYIQRGDMKLFKKCFVLVTGTTRKGPISKIPPLFFIKKAIMLTMSNKLSFSCLNTTEAKVLWSGTKGT